MPAGGINPGMAVNGVYPTEQGYVITERVLEPKLKRFHWYATRKGARA
jgi:hypothetical protein